jgi:glycosyltransferase involved in cell wall biosynthesis
VNILYYIPNITRNWGGVYQYALSLLKSLAEDTTNRNQFYVYILEENENYAALAKQYENIILILQKDKPNIQEPFLAEEKEPFTIAKPSFYPVKKSTTKIVKFFAVRYNYRVTQRYKKSGYKQVYYLDWVIRKNNIAVIHCPFQSIYTMQGIPSISTIHDVQELYFPQFFSSAARAHRAVHYKEAIDNAAAVIVSYDHIKKDIIRFFSKPEDQVHVCLIDMKDLWFDKFTKNDVLDLKEYHLPDKYILYPAATWEHKNHIRLIEAVAYLNKELKMNVHLVCTGHKDVYYQSIEKKIKDLSVGQHINFLGVVSDQVLYSLYHKASGVVVPTLYEAGSFPLMESMLMNIPVVCSNVTSLPDTIKDLRFIFDPYNYKDIADKIYKLLTEKSFLEENLQNSVQQVFKLRDSRVSEKVNGIYKKLAS